MYGLKPVPFKTLWLLRENSEEIGRVPQVSILRPGILLVEFGSGPIT
jgi:hypothetical protein